MNICLATNNLHKIEEIKSVLGNHFSIKTLKEIGCTEELPETGNTLEENSLQKAKYIFDKYKIACIADDSGLEIEALNNKPGVDSAHYAGKQRNDSDNINKVLSELNLIENRSSNFKTVITYIDSKGIVNQFVGIIEGIIIDKKIGESGFGYDPIFKPEGFDKTFAQMTPDEKNSISHRARALAKFKEFILK